MSPNAKRVTVENYTLINENINDPVKTIDNKMLQESEFLDIFEDSKGNLEEMVDSTIELLFSGIKVQGDTG